MPYILGVYFDTQAERTVTDLLIFVLYHAKYMNSNIYKFECAITEKYISVYC